MTELPLILLRWALWLLPGVLGLLGVRAWVRRRGRVGLGLLLAGLVAALLVRPLPLGFVLLALGALAGWPTGRQAPRQ
ncbi:MULTISPECIES: hypothetical protein [unclassified Meiothermus]|uniref:hypothetical protein n=1 Tax=unclassified Meiothermus TaxID=370471 RepID=UPI000D7D216D|nr:MULTISPECIES: hypothetical protein [unclassified Meiothermus]PZA06248.1 hypothetical protein DNA98_14185 [Meiothermus sp. Pnk-1]RYM39522.1 hypothetical protein EWH23_03270 [Meiothermus sp. PNK-Is4]